MFSKTFKAVFGVGAAVVATFSLAAAAIGAFALIAYLIDNPRQKAEARAFAAEQQVVRYETACAGAGPWNKYRRYPPKSATAALGSAPKEAEAEVVAWLERVGNDYDALDAFWAACKAPR